MGRSDERQRPLLDSLGRRQFLGGVAAAGAVAGAGGLLAACGGSSGGGGTSSPSTSPAAGTPKRGGSMSVGMTGGSKETDTLDPHGGLTYLDTSRAHSLYNPLYQLDHNAQPVYVLAEDNGIEANNQDTSDWIIKLREGVTFHDGKPLTADDVIYTFKRIITNGMGGKNSLGPMNLGELKADSNTSVRVKFDQPYGSFRDQLAYWYYLYIIPAGFDPTKNPGKENGTGPFKLESFTKGQQSVMVRNENYFRSGKPYLDKLTIIDFSDSSSMQNALTTGAIDAAGGIEGPQVAALAGNPAVKAVVSKTGAITPFTMRVDVKPFSDVRVRQALRLLVDRQQLIQSALNGFATVGADVFSPFDPDYKGYSRQTDVPQAKALLKKAGYGDSNPLQITLTTSPVATGTVAMATVLAEQAKAAGVQIKVDNVQPGTFFGPKYLHWDFSQDFWNFSPYLAQCAQSMQPHSPFNETHTNNPTLNNLYKAANGTADDAKRKQYVQQMMDFDFDNGGYIIPAFISALDAYSTKLAGYTPARVGQPLDDFNFEDFYFA